MQVYDHEVALFFPFYYSVESPGDQLCTFLDSLQHLTAQEVADAKDGIWSRTPSYDSLHSGTIWQSRTCKAAPELFSHVGNILNNKHPLIRQAGITSRCDDSLHAYNLTAIGKTLVTAGSANRIGKGLCVDLTDRAVKRLAAGKRGNHSSPPDSLPVCDVKILIKDIELYFFGTGAGIVTVRLQYAHDDHQLDSTTIQEANYATTRIGALNKLLRWVAHRDAGVRPAYTPVYAYEPTTDIPDSASTNEKQTDNVHNFGWPQLIESLLPGLGSLYRESVFKFDATHQGKLYAYTVVIADTADTQNTADAQMLAQQLARQTSLDYSITAETEAQMVYQPFTNIFHCASTEGASAILLLPVENSDFFQHFIRDNYLKSYLPIALLAYQEYLTVLRMSQGIITDIASNSDNENIIRLEQYQFMQLSFRLNYRFDSVSQYSQHNQLHELFRSAFRIAKLLEDVAQDNTEAHAYVATLQAKKVDRRQRFWGAWGLLLAAIFAITELTGISLLTALKQAKITKYYELWGLDKIIPTSHLVMSLYALAVAVTLLVIFRIVRHNRSQ